MSQENVESAERGVDAFNRLDIDAYAETCTADYEWYPLLAGGVEGTRSFRGRQGIEEYFAELRDSWADLRLVCGDFRDLGDRVLLLGRLEGRGRGSGVPVASPFAAIIDYREGKAYRNRVFNDHGEALRAAGVDS